MLRQFINITAFIFMIVINILANLLPLNGQTSAEISDRFPLLVTPANYVFSVWSLIYIGLTAFIIYQALPSQRQNPRLQRIGYWFAASSLANGAWLVLFHYEQFFLTIFAMIALLFSLVMIYTRLEIGEKAVSNRERWLVNAPFSLYMGWISVATIVNFGVAFYDAGWNGFGLSDVTWAVILISVAAVITAVLVITRTDFIYAGVIIWALVGIASKHSNTSAVVNIAVTAIIIITLALFARFFKNWRFNHNLLSAPNHSY